MNLHPYDWWAPGGAAQPWTGDIERLLERAIALQPRHPGAHHYWIHLQESSPHPQRALASADVLRDAVPGSGHLLHMPAHIDMRVGHFDAAIRASQRAIEADQRYLAEVDAQGAYRVGYVAHNHHFLWAAASMAGRRCTGDAGRAGRLARGLRAERPRPGHRDRSAVRRAAVLHAGALRRVEHAARRHAPARRARAVPASRSGTTPAARPLHARASSMPPRTSSGGSSGLRPSRRLRAIKLKNLNAGGRSSRASRVLTLRADIALGAWRCAGAAVAAAARGDADRRCARSPTSRICGWRRRAMRSARRCWPPAGPTRPSASTGKTCEHYPDNGWSLARPGAGARAAGPRRTGAEGTGCGKAGL